MLAYNVFENGIRANARIRACAEWIYLLILISMAAFNEVVSFDFDF